MPSCDRLRRPLVLTLLAATLAAAGAAPAAAGEARKPRPAPAAAMPPAAGHDVTPLRTPTPAAGANRAPAPATPRTAVGVPPTPAALPTAAEPTTPYIPATSCDYSVKPGTGALLAMLERTYPDSGSLGIVNTCLAEGTTSEHTEGRALDWAVSVDNPQQVAEVRALFAWLFATDRYGNTYAMARRLGIMYMIWDRQIWGAYSPDAAWRPYSCSGVTACHMDHVHFSLTWAGAWARTSYWSGRVAAVDYGPCIPTGQRYAPAYSGVNPTPCPYHPDPPAPTTDLSYMQQDQNLVVLPYDSGAPVAVLQRQVGVPADGYYGTATAAAVRAYQGSHRLPVTGTVGPATWRSFLGASAGGPGPTGDTTPPVGVLYPPVTRGTDVTVTWGGHDAGSGVSGGDVDVSTDGGPFRPWLVDAPPTFRHLTFAAGAGAFRAGYGHRYVVVARVRDAAGNVGAWGHELAAPAVTDTTPPQEVLYAPRVQGSALTVTYGATDSASGVRDAQVDVAVDGGPFRVWMPALAPTFRAGTFAAGAAVFAAATGHSYTFVARTSDVAGNTSRWGHWMTVRV